MKIVQMVNEVPFVLVAKCHKLFFSTVSCFHGLHYCALMMNYVTEFLFRFYKKLNIFSLPEAYVFCKFHMLDFEHDSLGFC